jgi:hypothetical protein
MIASLIASLIAGTNATSVATVAAPTAAAPLLAQAEPVRDVQRSADGSRLTVVLRRAEEVTCYDSDTQPSAACRVIRGRLCCESGGWLPPPYNRAVVEERVTYVIDCPGRRFDRRGDGRGWQPLERDAVVAEVAAAQCPAAGR